MKCTDEKNISLAVKGYKIFFSSTSLTSNSKPTSGLKINRKPVVGFNHKKRQLNSGRGKYLKTISDVDGICKAIGIETIKTDVIIDGGNVTRWTNKVIMTDRVFKDNPTYERKKLIKELYELLQVDKIYFVPEQPGDFTGHSDGMVRFVDEHTVIINDYKQEKEWFSRAFEIAIHNTGLDYITIPYNVYDNKSNDHANGDYINYLQMENTVIIPTFGIKEDDITVRQLETIFVGQNIQTIESNEIAYDGGILNCITWNIKTDK